MEITKINGQSLDRHVTEKSRKEELPNSKEFQFQRPTPSFNLMPKYLQLIRSGIKTVEGRCATEAYKNLKSGDTVKFCLAKNASDYVACEVIQTTQYPTFAEMLKKEGTFLCIPGAKNLSSAHMIYKRIPGYAEKEKIHGVIGIQLRVLPDLYI